jgi:biopolymer transport protein ExbD
MAMTTGGSGRRAEINVTPLIDVLLVLLIIFMVITPLKSRGFEARIPQPGSSDSAASNTPREMVIRVSAGGRIEVNTQAVALEDLVAKIRPGLRPGDVIFVQGEEGLEFREVAAVLDRAKEAGAGAFAFIPWNKAD